MGLRCLVGHDYGNARTSRDQQARGDEVVVTVREYRECTRCGHQRVISENKEVKVGTPAEASTGSGGSADDASAAGEEPDGDRPHSGWGAARVGEDVVEPMTAEEDDGIILEDEPERATRAHGEWPGDGLEAGEDGPADADAEGAAAGPGDEGAADVEAGDSGTPEAPDGTAGDGSTDAGAAGGDAEIIDAEAAGPTGATGGPEPAADAGETTSRRPDGRDTEFVCPECGETWPAVNSSLRPGDICPQCRRGYLAEQVAQ